MCGPEVGWYTCDHLYYSNISCADKGTEGHKAHGVICDVKIVQCPFCLQPETTATSYVKSILLTGCQLADILNADPYANGYVGMVARFYARGDHKDFNQPGPEGPDPEGKALIQRVDETVQRLRARYGTATFALPEKFAGDSFGHAFDVALNEIAQGTPDTNVLTLNGERVEPIKATDVSTGLLDESPGMADANASPAARKAGLDSPPPDTTSASASSNQKSGQSSQGSSSSQNAPSARVTPDSDNDPLVESSSSQQTSADSTPTSSKGQTRSSPGVIMSTSGTPAPANGQTNPAPMPIMPMAMPSAAPVQGSISNPAQFPIPMTPGAATFGQTPINNQRWPQVPSQQVPPMGTGLPTGSYNQGFGSNPQFPNTVFVSPASMYGQVYTPNNQSSSSPMGLPTGAYTQPHGSGQQSPQILTDPALIGGQAYSQYNRPPSTPVRIPSNQASIMGTSSPFTQGPMSSSTASSKQSFPSMGPPMTSIKKGGHKRSESTSPSSPTPAPKRGRKNSFNRAQNTNLSLGTPNMNFDGTQGNKGKTSALAPAGPVVMTFDTKTMKTPRKTPISTKSKPKPKPKPKPKFSDKSVLIIEHPSMLNASPAPAKASVARPVDTNTPAGTSDPFVNACIHPSSLPAGSPSQTPSSTPTGTAPKTPCSIPKGTKAKKSGSAPTPSNQTDNTPISHFEEKSLADTIKDIPKKYPVFHKMYQTHLLKMAYEKRRDEEEKGISEKKDHGCCPCA